MNVKRAPFDKPDIRRAVMLAPDRQELVTTALDGAGAPCVILDPKLVGRRRAPAGRAGQAPRLPPTQGRRRGGSHTLKSLESAAGFAAFGKGDFQMIVAQDRAMDSTDPGEVFAFV